MSCNDKCCGDVPNHYMEGVENLVKLSPAVSSFFKFVSDTESSSKLDAKTKELIYVAIAITKQCQGCINLHTKKLVEVGATKEEMVSLLNLCIVMGGGPALMHSGEALKAFEEFASK